MLFRWLTWAVTGQPAYMLTSRPYPLELTENLLSSGGSVESGEISRVLIEYSGELELLTTTGGSLVSGKHGDTLYNYPVEGLAASGGALVSGKHGDIQYVAPFEELHSTGGALVSGKYGDIHYASPEESLNTTGGALESGIHG